MVLILDIIEKGKFADEEAAAAAAAAVVVVATAAPRPWPHPQQDHSCGRAAPHASHCFFEVFGRFGCFKHFWTFLGRFQTFSDEFT